MSTTLVGKRLLLTVSVLDRPSDAFVDPGSFEFRLKAPATSGYAPGTYAWDGSIWTSSEAVIAVPARAALGIFTLRITIPYANVAAGAWSVGVHALANGSGLGEGSAATRFVALASEAL